MGKSGSSMQMTRAADYAIRALIHLAGLPLGQRVMLPDLARAIGAPDSFLSKVMQALCRAGLVASRRGQSGGFEILKRGRNATISSVVAAVDSPMRLNICLLPGRSCERKENCPVRPVWARAQAAMLQVLDARTIADFALLNCGHQVPGNLSQNE
jgi:Rrf2 family protein